MQYGTSNSESQTFSYEKKKKFFPGKKKCESSENISNFIKEVLQKEKAKQMKQLKVSDMFKASGK